MRFVSTDSETHLIRPGMPAPRMVCVSAANQSGTELHDRSWGLALLTQALREEDKILIGHNIFYDLGVACAENPSVVVPLVFKAFEQNRIRDTIVRQQLIDIAQGDLKYRYDEEAGEYVKTGYKLSQLCHLLLDRELPKEGTWRLRYALLDGVPISEWPEDA